MLWCWSTALFSTWDIAGQITRWFSLTSFVNKIVSVTVEFHFLQDWSLPPWFINKDNRGSSIVKLNFLTFCLGGIYDLISFYLLHCNGSRYCVGLCLRPACLTTLKIYPTLSLLSLPYMKIRGHREAISNPFKSVQPFKCSQFLSSCPEGFENGRINADYLEGVSHWCNQNSSLQISKLPSERVSWTHQTLQVQAV